MKIFFALVFIVFCSYSVAAQNNIKKTAGVNYTGGPPTYTPSLVSGSEYAIDTTNGYFYQWHRTTSVWLRVGQGIDVFGSSGSPGYAPVRNVSWFAINTGDSLYRYSGSGVLWDCINCVSGSGGTVTSVAATAPAAGFTITGSPITTSDTFVFTLANDLAALEALATTGIPARTGADTWSLRNITAGTGAVTVTNGDGVAGNPTINNTDPDQSTTNEIQTYSHAGTTTYTNTLSNGGGAFTLNSGAGITLSHTAGTTTISSSLTNFYQLFRDDGADKTQRAAANFVSSTRIATTLTDDAANGETEVLTDLVLNSVADAYLSQRGALTVMGRAVNSTGNVADIVSTADGQVLRRNGTTLDWGTVQTIGIANQAVTYVKIQNAVSDNVLLGNNNGANTSYKEINPAAAQTMLGYIDGAGANQRIPYFTDANTLAAEAAFLYDATNDRQTITSTTPGLGAGAAILNLTNTGPDGTGEFLQIRGDISVNLLSGMLNTNTSATANCIWNIGQTGNSAGDAILQLQIAGVGGNTTAIGEDNSDVNKFKITPNGAAPGVNANASFVATMDAIPLWGINKDAPGFVFDVGGRERTEQDVGINVAWVAGDVFFGLGAGTAPTFTAMTGTHNRVRLLFKTGTAPTANNNIFAIQRKANYQYAVKGFPVLCAGNAATAGEITKFYVGGDNGINVNVIANGTLTASTDYELVISWSGY